MPDPISRLNAALVGRYEIERELGEGGMATVYLAADLKHERKVALKVLKPELAAVVGAERFLAEIKTTANLQHPHILPLFDSGEADSFLFYVMPYVEGETLRERIEREKQLPVDTAVQIATSIASALQHAHERGVIHRDIKPGNILLQDGQPVVSDFGIALAVGSAGGARLTETGLSVGTPWYMSPEQATGDQTVGPQSDTYALGAVLFEMLVGDPPYMGSTAQAVLGKIIQGVPVSATATRKTVPGNVDAAIRKSLEKLPADRFTGAQEFAVALADPGFRHGDAVLAGSVARGGVWNRLSVTLAVTTLVLMAALGSSWSRPEPTRSVQRFSVPFEPGQEPALTGPAAFSLSPDGTMLVYRHSEGATIDLWVRRWDELYATPIPETSLGVWPTVSPDGQGVAFQVGVQVHVLSFAGGPVRLLGEGSFPRWGSDGYVYMSVDSGTVRVPASGGAAESVTRISDGEALHWISDVMPDGRGALVQVNLTSGESEIRVLDLGRNEMRHVAFGQLPRYAASGHLTYVADGALMAAPFDARRMELTRPAVPVVDDVEGYSLSADGKLFYGVLPGGAAGLLQLMWVSREGVATPVDPDWSFDPSSTAGNRSWALSPDGTRIAVKILTDLGPDIWIKQLPDGPLSRLTFDEGEDRFARWAPDSRSVTFLSDRGGKLDLWSRAADGTGDAELLLEIDGDLAEGSWSPDREWLVLRTLGTAGAAVGGRDIHGLRPGIDSTLVPLVVTEFDESAPALSSDGRWMAYQSDETGRREIFVRPFPDTDRGKWQVSTGGGRAAVWANSGREIFYLTDANAVMVAEIDAGPPFVVGERRMLFDPGPDYYFMNNSTSWGVTADDQTFLMARQYGGTGEVQRQFVLVNNFFEELKERVGN